MELPFDPAIPLLGLYPKNPETPIQKNLCTPMFLNFKKTFKGEQAAHPLIVKHMASENRV